MSSPLPRSDEVVLVTGATGFLGSHLVKRLVSDGARVRILVRSANRARSLAELRVEVTVGDIQDETAVHSALRGALTVYHLAGKLLVPGARDAEYRATHVDATKLLLAHSRGQSQLRRFVHCSTTGVLGVTGAEPADEGAPLRPTNIYEATKAEAELAIRDAMRSGFPAVIVRPGLVYGPGDLHLLGFFRSVFRGRFRPIGRRPVWLHPIYVDDMVDAVVRCGRHPAAVGECFHIAGPEPVSLAALAAAIANAEGTDVPSGTIPLPAARAVAIAGDLLPGNVRRAAPLTRSRLDFLTHSRVYSVAKAKRVIDFTPATDLSTGMARTVAWYRDHGYLPARSAA